MIQIIIISINNILLEVCKINKDESIKDFSSNYVFKVKSNKINNFKEYIIKSDEIKYNYNKDKKELSLSIPKILNINETKAEEARYSMRLFSKYSFKDDETPNSIAFVSYNDYSTYIYYVNSDNNGINNLEMTIKDFPISGPYYVSVLGTITFCISLQLLSHEIIVQLLLFIMLYMDIVLIIHPTTN